MIHTAKLLEAPQLRDGVRIARAALQPGGQEVRARIVPTAGGVYLPYARGNRVLVAVAHGDPEAGVYVVGRFTTPPGARNAGNIELHAASGRSVVIRAASGDVVVASESERVLLGTEDADPAYVPIACYEALDRKLRGLQQQVDALVALLNSSPSGVAPGPGAVAGLWTEAMRLYAVATYSPGEADPSHETAASNSDVAARNVYAKPDDPL